MALFFDHFFRTTLVTQADTLTHLEEKGDMSGWEQVGAVHPPLPDVHYTKITSDAKTSQVCVPLKTLLLETSGLQRS
jgi:hypothetical protein